MQFAEMQSLCIILQPVVCTGNGIRMAADSVLSSQKLNIRFRSFLLKKLLIDAPFTIFNSAAAAEHIINRLLRHNKSRVFFGLGFANQRKLFIYAGQNCFIR